MKRFLRGFNIGNALLLMAVLLVPIISNSCRLVWYQPEEPEGLKDFSHNLSFK